MSPCEAASSHYKESLCGNGDNLNVSLTTPLWVVGLGGIGPGKSLKSLVSESPPAARLQFCKMTPIQSTVKKSGEVGGKKFWKCFGTGGTAGVLLSSTSLSEPLNCSSVALSLLHLKVLAWTELCPAVFNVSYHI